MQTIRKNVKNYLLFVAYAVLLLLVLVFAIFLFPDSPLGTLPIFYIPERKAEIAWAFLTIFLCFMGYKFYRSIKCAENPRQAIWDNLKAHIVILLSISAIGYVGMVLFTTLFLTNYDRCDYYSKHLNGCVKEYQGQKFKVHMCGIGAGSYSNGNDEIRLQVFNEKGKLVALRHFGVHWDSLRLRQLEYHSDHLIIYYDDDSDDDYKKTLSMPPTTLDWIRARIPLLD